MAKKIFSDADVAKMQDVPAKKPRGKKVFSDKEVAKMSEVPETEGADEDGSILEDIAFIGEGIDRFTGAPLRAAVGAAQAGENPFSAGFEQLGEPSRLAPTGKEIMMEAGVSDEPMMDVPYIGEVSPAGALGLGTEFMLDPSAAAGAAMKGVGLASKAIRPVRVAVKGAAAKQAFKAVAQLSTPAKISETMSKGASGVVGQNLMDLGLAKHLNNPEKLLDKIAGEQTTKYVTKKIGKKSYDISEKVRGSGLIRELSDSTDLVVNQVSDAVDPIDVKTLVKELTEADISMRMDPNTAAKNFSGQEIAAYEKELQKILKPIGGEAADARSVSQLQEIKRSLGNQIQSKKFYQPADKAIALEKEAKIDVYQKLNEVISEKLRGVQVQSGDDIVDAGEFVSRNNQQISSMMDVRMLLEQVPAKELKSADLKQTLSSMLMTGGAGVGAGMATGSTTSGLMVAGGVGLASKAGDKIQRSLPGVTARAIDYSLKNPGVPTKMAAPSALRQLRRLDEDNMPDPSRSPQSLGVDVNFMVADTEIPRSTEYVMEHPNLTVSKVMQAAGPEEAAKVQMAIKKGNRRLLETTLPILAQQYPEIFEPDEYNSFDGKIIDPDQRARYSDSVYEREDISEYEKAEIIDHLNKKNEVLR